MHDIFVGAPGGTENLWGARAPRHPPVDTPLVLNRLLFVCGVKSAVYVIFDETLCDFTAFPFLDVVN